MNTIISAVLSAFGRRYALNACCELGGSYERPLHLRAFVEFGGRRLFGLTMNEAYRFADRMTT